MTDKTGKELLNADEAAAQLRITKRTLLRWAREGKIERVIISKKVVLFSIEAIEEFVKNKTSGLQSKTGKHEHAGRAAWSSKPVQKGGGKKSSGESWRSLRKEVATWQ
jgi:excisionase family DNA binding protein